MSNLATANDSEYHLDKRFERLLDEFEKEVEPYDRWAGMLVFATPLGIVISIFLPLLLINFLRGQINPYSAITSVPLLYIVLAGIGLTIGLTKISLLYLDFKKHKISTTKYRPVAGVCMCDLSHLRSQIRKMEKSKTIGERIKHVKLINYYRHQMGWQ